MPRALYMEDNATLEGVHRQEGENVPCLKNQSEGRGWSAEHCSWSIKNDTRRSLKKLVDGAVRKALVT